MTGGPRHDHGVWKSDNLDISLFEFMDMYHVTENEIRTEGFSGRIKFFGVPTPEGGYGHVHTSESEVKRWLKSRMPPSVASKVKALGRLAPLKAWRKAYFDKCQIDLETNAIILPDGTRVTGVRVGPHRSGTRIDNA